ncbi:MAG: M28 family peptidase [Alphaproteobacteria bacterium]|nr:MAG: M28 family peptidase [Alphaproteobacteria bacterium]
MALAARDIFNLLREWPHRGAGTEEEMEAREALVAELTGIPDLDITEEGFTTPRSYLPFFWTIALCQAVFVMVAPLAPMAFAGAAFLLFASHVLYFDWRVSPLIWLGGNTVSANLVARKGAGRRLLILMAHLDSAPASFAYRADQVRHFGLSVWLSTGIVAFGVLVPLAVAAGLDLPLWLRGIFALVLVGQVVLASVDFWRHGFTPGANDNLTGVACATEVATRMWDQLPADTEVRLVITSAEEAGMLGAQHYWRQHQDELKARDTHVLNIDTVGAGKLAIVGESGGFTRVYYDTALMRAAAALSQLNPRYAGVRPVVHKVGDFDSVWFVRDGISALTLAAYDKDGLMPHIHTQDDRAVHVDLGLVEDAVEYAEALLRLLPTPLENKEKKP